MNSHERDRRRLLQELVELRQENRRLRESNHRGVGPSSMIFREKPIIQILDNHIEPALTCLANGRITAANEMLVSKLDVPKEELIGANLEDFIHPDDRESIRERLGFTNFEDPELNYEFRLNSRDGCQRWLQWARAPISFDPEKGPEILLIGRDITDLKIAQFLALAQRDLSVSLSEVSTLEEALDLCLEGVLNISGMDAAGVYLFDNDFGLRLSANKGLAPEKARSVAYYPPESPESNLVKNGEPIYLNEGLSENSARLMKELELNALALIPICSKGRPVGCFIVASEDAQEAPVSARHSLETIAAQIGAAIIRVRTQEKLEKTRAELEESVERRTEELKQAVQSLKAEVAERRRAEESLRRSETEYRTLFENLRDGWISATLDGELTNCNAEFEAMLGYRLEELKGRHYRDFTPGKWLDIQEQIMREKLLQSGYSGLYEKEYIRRNGDILPVEIATYLQRDEQGNPVGMWGLVRDISERKRAEEEIQRLGAAVEQAAEIIFITDTRGKILYVNPAFEKTTGYKAEEVLGKTPGVLKSGKHPAGFYEDMWTTIQQGAVWKGRIINKRADGSLYEEEATISPIRDKSGAIANFVAVKRDITNEVALERHLRQAQKMEAIGTLAGGIAHDFNNLLQVIVGYTQMAMRDTLAGGRVHSRLEQVFNAGVRATELVKQILSFSRQVDREKGPAQLGPIVKETCKFLKASTPANVEIRAEVEDNLDLIMADPTQMHQVIMNLGANAAQAMNDKGGLIEVTLVNATIESNSPLLEQGLSPGKYVRLTVRDTGDGIPPHVCERLFEPYFTTKSVSEGTGLGLAVVHGIVSGHNGVILVNSQVGKGSEFIIYIPSISKGAALIDAPDKPIPTGRETILFVDDEEAIVEIGAEMLEDLGYDILTSCDPLKALELFKKTPAAIDLIITDMSMPKLSGLEFATEILAVRPDIPVVICTGFSSSINEREAKKLGVRAFLMKPILRNQLAQTIRSVLDK